jgi:hypothetical protein
MKRCFTVMLVVAGMLLASQAQAAIIKFKVDPTRSALTITPSVNLFGATQYQVTPQGLGSFTTSYSGSLYADITPTTIQLLAPSSLVAGISGNWKPGTDYSNYPGDANDPNGYPNTAEPANYGVMTNFIPLNGRISLSAIRDLEISLVDSVPKALAGGGFPEAGTLTDFTSGTIYYNSGAAPPITDMANTLFPGPLADFTGNGTLATIGTTQTLAIPLQFTVDYNIAVLSLSTTYTGMIVATAIPEPATALLLTAAFGALVVVRRSR